MRFLIGTDGSHDAAAGVELVRAFALRADDEVIVAAVAEVPIGFETLAGPPTALVWHDELRTAVLARCRAALEPHTPQAWSPAASSTVLAEGAPLRELTRLARDQAVDAVVVGPHGRGRLETLILGSVSQGLLHAGTVPVVVARPLAGPLRRVLVGIDGSDGARAAVEWVAALPLPAGTLVQLTSVLRTHEGPYGRAWSDELYPLVIARERQAATAALAEASDRLAGHDLVVTTTIREGAPKVDLVEAARELGAELIVLGARGVGGFEELVLGSVSRAVAKIAPCSVAVVHRRAP